MSPSEEGEDDAIAPVEAPDRSTICSHLVDGGYKVSSAKSRSPHGGSIGEATQGGVQQAPSLRQIRETQPHEVPAAGEAQPRGSPPGGPPSPVPDGGQTPQGTWAGVAQPPTPSTALSQAAGGTLGSLAAYEKAIEGAGSPENDVPWGEAPPAAARHGAFGLTALPDAGGEALPVPHVRIGPSSALADADRAALLEDDGEGGGHCERGCSFGTWC